MKTRAHCLMAIAGCLWICGTCTAAPAQDYWISGYYPGWIQDKLPPGKVPLESISHLLHFAASVKAEGSLDLQEFQLSDEHIKATVKAAHLADKKILLVLGGANSGPGFRSATGEKNVDAFVRHIVETVERYGYDGIDLDWEPIATADNARYEIFVKQLHQALKKRDARFLLSAATAPDPWNNPGLPRMFAGIQDRFDQINLMTYVLSGAWEDWISWFGSPLFNGGQRFPGGRELPSMENIMGEFEKAGIKPGKLGIGLAFHGDVWKGGTGTGTGGVTAPRQKWEKAPSVHSDVGYAEIMKKYYRKDRAFFDEKSRTPYLSLDEAGSENDLFASYCDAAALAERLEFMKQKGYGGAIIWHLGEDLMPDGSQPLAEAVKSFRQKLVP